MGPPTRPARTGGTTHCHCPPAAWSRAHWEDHELHVPLGGRFNLENAVVAALAARSLGIEPDVITRAIAGAGPVPGRFEPGAAGQPFPVLVDYAHTPDGLEQVLLAAREVAGQGKVLVVFGCGGDRDRTKRGPMGGVAGGLGGQVVVSTRNTR